MKKIALLVVLLTAMQSCTVVKEYEKVALSDPDMALSTRSVERFKTNFQAYREAASGANGGKTGGGCGCN
ncbi:MAG: arginine decarboxylase [Bacteroidetes bacterium HGW-Bacteroidetes-2]|jgi:hypothetical protein|nr:MAG: arginine decarboxylase [Bacteroidetes bacterium HGW-Bacteroidetes-2]